MPIIIACLNDCSAIGPKIKPIINGAAGKLNLLKKYPISPKKNKRAKSKEDLPFPYTPADEIIITLT